MRRCADWLQAYSEYTANLEAPAKFHYWTGVSTIAGALRGKVWINMGKWKWKPNFFIFFVAPPGIIGKSTTISVGMSLLREVEGIHFGPDSATWQGVTDAFSDAGEAYPFANGDFVEMSAITLSISELGTFLDPKNREMVDLLVNMWDGWEGPWKRRTKGEGESVIINPWLNLIGCTTPAWIAENFTEYHIGGGLTSRTVFVYGDHKRRLIAYPHLEEGASAMEGLRDPLITDLKDISTMAGEFRLSPDAITWGKAWYDKHWLELPDHLKDDRMGGYVARKQTHIHKLALIVSAARGDDMLITEEHLSYADGIMTASEEDIPKVFSRISTSIEAKYAQWVLSAIRTHGKITRRNLVSQAFTRMSMSNFDEATKILIEAGKIKLVQNGSDILFIYQETPSPDTTDQLLDTVHAASSPSAPLVPELPTSSSAAPSTS